MSVSCFYLETIKLQFVEFIAADRSILLKFKLILADLYIYIYIYIFIIIKFAIYF